MIKTTILDESGSITPEEYAELAKRARNSDFPSHNAMHLIQSALPEVDWARIQPRFKQGNKYRPHQSGGEKLRRVFQTAKLHAKKIKKSQGPDAECNCETCVYFIKVMQGANSK